MTGTLIEADGRRRCEGDRCRGVDDDSLVGDVVLGGRHVTLCAPCWHLAGRPPAVPAPEVWAKVEATRESMLKRGGSDRHMVRSGKAGL